MLTAGISVLLLQASPGEGPRLVDPDPLCGAYCLYLAMGSLDDSVPPFKEFQEQLGEPGAAGYSLGELAEFAEGQGMHTLGVKTNCENLQRRPERFACIAYLNHGHFVLFSDVSDGAVTLIDAPLTSTVSPDILSAQWDGTALLVANQPLLAEEDLPRGRSWVWWTVLGGVAAVTAVLLFFRMRAAE